VVKNEKLNDNERNCILMRLGEKKILKFYLNFSKFCLSMIEIKDETVCYYLIRLENNAENQGNLRR
jgi:hypothetical protein